MVEPFPARPASNLSVTQVVPSEFPAVESDPALQLAYAIAAAADDRKGSNITIFQVGDVSYLADYFVLVTGFSNVQVRAIARSIEQTLEADWKRRPLRTEGLTEGNWILQDYGEVIVHIFLPEEREFYNLDAFWSHAQHITYQPPAPPAKG